MSHDHSRRDSCEIRLSSREFHSEIDSIARGVTAVVVGSGALLGEFFVRLVCRTSILKLRGFHRNDHSSVDVHHCFRLSDDGSISIKIKSNSDEIAAPRHARSKREIPDECFRRSD